MENSYESLYFPSVIKSSIPYFVSFSLSFLSYFVIQVGWPYSRGWLTLVALYIDILYCGGALRAWSSEWTHGFGSYSSALGQRDSGAQYLLSNCLIGREREPRCGSGLNGGCESPKYSQITLKSQREFTSHFMEERRLDVIGEWRLVWWVTSAAGCEDPVSNRRPLSTHWKVFPSWALIVTVIFTVTSFPEISVRKKFTFLHF